MQVAWGKDFVTIICQARAEAADLIVLGAHGAHFIRDLFTGTTAEKVVRQGDRPVLVVKKAPHGPYRRVLVPVDFSDPSRRALELAMRIAPEAMFSVLHAYEILHEYTLRRARVSDHQIIQYRREAAKAAREQMDTFLQRCNLPAKTIKPLVRYGHPSTVIHSVARQRRADLITIGTHGRTGLGYVLLGSVAEHVLREASCDVLAARPAAFRFELP